MTNRRYVYVLIDPITQFNGFVGTTRDADKLNRLHPSRWAYSSRNPAKNEWIRSLLAKGVKPKIFVVTETTARRAAVLKKRWIDRLTRMGAKLFNIDKAQKCREISLAKWSSVDFALKVKAGILKRQERIKAERLKGLESVGTE